VNDPARGDDDLWTQGRAAGDDEVEVIVVDVRVAGTRCSTIDSRYISKLRLSGHSTTRTRSTRTAC
jgi:hypothetical protein